MGMLNDLTDLPEDRAEVAALVGMMTNEIKSLTLMNEQLKFQLSKQRQHWFGSSSDAFDQLKPGFEELYRGDKIKEVACMAHVRRKFVDLHKANGLAIAEEAIKRIAALYAMEKEARGSPPDKRVELRQSKAKPIFDDLEVWLDAQLAKISGKSQLAKDIRYALSRMRRMRSYLENGFLELDNNTAERSIRSVALGRKNYLFMDSEKGGKAAAIIYSLTETAKLNNVDPQGWLTFVLSRTADQKVTELDELMPW